MVPVTQKTDKRHSRSLGPQEFAQLTYDAENSSMGSGGHATDMPHSPKASKKSSEFMSSIYVRLGRVRVE